jgi:hypothetical protein
MKIYFILNLKILFDALSINSFSVNLSNLRQFDLGKIRITIFLGQC